MILGCYYLGTNERGFNIEATGISRNDKECVEK